jgi:N-acetylneuraminate synthase
MLSFQRLLTHGHRVIVIAELGINHNGQIDMAKELIRGAADAQTSGIKFQYRNLSKSYRSEIKEIGDELLESEIIRNYLSPETIIELLQYAHSLGLYVGISFFNEGDILDFGTDITKFDFFKVPSVELQNKELIVALCKLDKHLLLSTGAHSETEIEEAFNRIPSDDWTPLHCISNYPTMPFNAKLGYISHLQQKWRRRVGYSSHDIDWSACIGAIAIGASVIERHITKDKELIGLDHSSSSDFREFKLLNLFARNAQAFLSGNESRVPNQGEFLNLQNLGRSYYATKPLQKASNFTLSDFEYRSPRVGVSREQAQILVGRKFERSIAAGEVLNLSDFEPDISIEEHTLTFAKAKRISLPVRIHDYSSVSTNFPLNDFEFHLSFREVERMASLDFIELNHRISIHLPDYTSPNQLMDPFAEDATQARQSNRLIDKIADMVLEFQEKRQSEVVVVGSFSTVHGSKEAFYESHKKLVDRYRSRGVQICLQWLPPFAWYFGGSVELGVMNSTEDAEYVRNYELPICLDTSHFFLGREFFQFDADYVLNLLIPNSKHFHLSDSRGFDAEGLRFGSGPEKNTKVIQSLLEMNNAKVIEVWQGHLNHYEGFRIALEFLEGMNHER